MAIGSWTWFDRALLKIGDGTIRLDSHTFNMVLLTSAQALTAGFVGGSGDARYADLTAELTTANGYTVGGVALTAQSLARVGTSAVGFNGTAAWTPTGAGLVFKYAAIRDVTAANGDLVSFVDLDTTGGSVTATNVGPLQFTPSANGIVGWHS